MEAPQYANAAGDPFEDLEALAVSRILSSTPDETRVRRAADVGTVVLSALVIFLAAWAVDDGTGPERWFARVWAAPLSGRATATSRAVG